MVPSATVFFCVCVLAVHSIDGEERRKFIAGNTVSGLISFPRTGRSDRLWKMGSQVMKRQSLLSFPRTGRREMADPEQPPEVKKQSLVSFPRTGKRDGLDQLPEVYSPDRRETGMIWALLRMKDLPMTGDYPKLSSGESIEENRK